MNTVLKTLFGLSFLLSYEMAQAYDLSGNVKTFAIGRDFPSNSSLDKSIQLSSKIQFLSSITDNTKFEAAYELSAFLEKPKNHSTKKMAYRAIDFKPYLHDEKPSKSYKTLVTHNLNRFNFNSTFSTFDLNIGRMPIAFGSSKSINPTDVLVPFAVNVIDKEERTGVDTLQIKTQIDEFLLIETGVIAGEDLDQKKSALYIRPRVSINELEIIFTAMHFKEKKLLGIDLQHPIQDAGFWLETAFVDQKEIHVLGVNDFLRVTTGIDYKFASTLYLAGEYHFNGASGNNNPFNPLDFIYLRDKHYFIATTSYELTPLLTGSLQTYYNTQDQSTLSLIKMDYNFLENVYFNVGSFFSTGNKYQDEFSRLGKTYYSSLRYYF